MGHETQYDLKCSDVKGVLPTYPGRWHNGRVLSLVVYQVRSSQHNLILLILDLTFLAIANCLPDLRDYKTQYGLLCSDVKDVLPTHPGRWHSGLATSIAVYQVRSKVTIESFLSITLLIKIANFLLNLMGCETQYGLTCSDVKGVFPTCQGRWHDGLVLSASSTSGAQQPIQV